MMPSVIYEKLVSDLPLAGMIGSVNGVPAIFELQSVDERPVHDKHFVVIDLQESRQALGGATFGPQVMQIWVHISSDVSRDFGEITKILNRIDSVILPLVHEVGTDGVRVTQVDRQGRSRNTIDPGWGTATRNALYGVLYDESAA